MDRGAWRPTVRGITRVRHDLATKPPPPGKINTCSLCKYLKGSNFSSSVSNKTT